MSGQLSLIKKNIYSVFDYPKQGVLFRDISPLLANHKAYSTSISLLAQHYRNYKLTKIVGIEARGFLFGAPLALELNLGFIPVRKLGKLPQETINEKYMLEYGVSYLEIHSNSIHFNDKVLIVDDILATGGTIVATVKLIRRLGGEVCHAASIVNLKKLGGEKLLADFGINNYSLVVFSES